MISKRVFITGKVQGVGFRFHAHEKAHELKLMGYVRNLKDGRVEMVIVGSEKDVNEMIKWSHKGPNTAKVDSVEVLDAKDEHFDDFSIRRD